MKTVKIKPEDPKALELFDAMVERYKVQNPVKFALKKVELEAKRAKLVGTKEK